MSTIDPTFEPKHVLQRMSDDLAFHEAVFVSMATKVHGKLEMDYQNRPSRSIFAVGADGITRQVQLCAVLRDPRMPMSEANWTFQLNVDAWRDVEEERMLWSKNIRQLNAMPNSNDELALLLDNSWAVVSQVTATDLSCV